PVRVAGHHPVMRRRRSQPGRRTTGVSPYPLGAGAGGLRPDAPEPDAGVLPRAAAHEADGPGPEADAEDFGDALEILVDGIVPVVVEAALAIPCARLLLRRLGEFVETVDRRFDHLRHDWPLPSAGSTASRQWRSSRPSRPLRGPG